MRSTLLRAAARRWRAGLAAALAVLAAGTVGLVVGGGTGIFGDHTVSGAAQVAPTGSGGAGAMSGNRPVLVPPPPASGKPAAPWNWREHPGMGPTRVSTAVTHPLADHAGAGLERLGQHRRVVTAALVLSAAPAAASSSAPQGLDVSAYQPNINWSSVWNAGGRFAFMKATEGTGYVSSEFGAQYTGSYDAGLIRGAYHFALPDRSSGATQADYFIDNGGGWSADGQTLPGALDIEYNPYGSECYGLSGSGMVSWISSFLNEYAARTSRWPVIYSTTDWWSTCTGNYGGFAGNDPLWLACYCGSAGTLPAGWPTQTIWQYADSGTFPGDQDLFNGDMGGLRRLAAGSGTYPAAVVSTTGTVHVYVRGTNRAGYEDSLPAGGTWSGLHSLGGTWPSNLNALSSSSGQVYVFGVGTTGALYVSTLTGTSWSGWQNLGSPSGGAQGRPAAIQDRSGTIRVYVRSTGGNLYEAHLSPGGHWSVLWGMGGWLPDNTAALAGADGYVWVFGIGTDRALYERHLPPGGSWSGWDRLGGSVMGIPAVTQDHAGTIRVYVRGTNGSIYEVSRASGHGWSGFWGMGGRLIDSAGASTDSSGRVWVFAVGTDFALYERHLAPGGTWSGWNRLGGSVTGVPAVTQDHSGVLRVYLRGTNGGLYEAHLSATGPWSVLWGMGGALF